MLRPALLALLAAAACLASAGCPPSGPNTAQKAPDPPAAQENLPPRYERRAIHDPDGIGVFYMGREIAQVMGHQAAEWLDRPEREIEELPTLMVRSIGLKPGMVVADIGAGSGFISFLLAREVGPKGKVYAQDIQPEMIEIVRRKVQETGARNVVPWLGTTTDTKLPPGSVDLIILVDVYHEFDRPYEMTEAMLRALKPKGRLVLVEYRKEDPTVPIKEVHKMTEAQIRLEMGVHPLDFVKTVNVLPRQHICIFQKRA